MISWAIRYQPILTYIRRRQAHTVLEVGSGPEGLSMFWRGRIAGVDLAFKRRPLHRAVRASATALPFPNQSWPVVVSCDMLEHVPPSFRRDAVMEMCRVAAQALIVAFPSGDAAAAGYAGLARRLHGSWPVWLKEHLDHGLPDATEVCAWLDGAGWQTRIEWHESVASHMTLVWREMRQPGKVLSYTLMRAAGFWLAGRWPSDKQEPRLRAYVLAEQEA